MNNNYENLINDVLKTGNGDYKEIRLEENKSSRITYSGKVRENISINSKIVKNNAFIKYTIKINIPKKINISFFEYNSKSIKFLTKLVPLSSFTIIDINGIIAPIPNVSNNPPIDNKKKINLNLLFKWLGKIANIFFILFK